MEQFAELGAVGLVLLVTAFGTPLVVAWRVRRQRLVPFAFGGLVAYLVHASVDWDWEMPAVTLCGLACAGALLASGDRRWSDAAAAPRRLARLSAVTVLLVASAFAFVAMVGNRALDQARAAADKDDVTAMIRNARTAARWAPWSSEPLGIQADAALERGTMAQARTLYREAIAKDPHDWEYWFGLALAAEGPERQRALARAAQLDPLAAEIAQLRASRA